MHQTDGMTKHDWYSRPEAREWTTSKLGSLAAFHESLPGYAPTRLVDVPELAEELEVGRVLVKEESSRLGLPAFKILGAAYAVARAVAERLGIADQAPRLEHVRSALDEARASVADGSAPVRLYAATDGNHGRAVAHMARLLGLPARIYVPAGVTAAAQQAIADEGAEISELDLDYDDVVTSAASGAEADPVGLQIQDTSWPGYEEVPQWIVDGYSTLFEEADRQLTEFGEDHFDLVVVPLGVGSIGQSAVRHYRSAHDATGRAHRPSVLSVEPVAAPAVIASLRAGRAVTAGSGRTIMNGLNCGTPSGLAWPILHAGLDAAVTVTDAEAAQAVHDLEDFGVDSGPCGAATLAGLRRALLDGHRADLGLTNDSTVLLLSTEGRQANPLPPEYARS